MIARHQDPPFAEPLVKADDSHPALPCSTLTHPAMGTVMTHKIYSPDAGACLVAIRGEIQRLESRLSRFIPGSDISRINESAGLNPEPVNQDTLTVLEKAVKFSKECPGCFNVTVEPLIDLWHRSSASSTAPEDASIQKTLSLVNYRDLNLNPWEMTAGLNHAGQAIDLGGIGKGYTGDKILEILKDFGVCSAYSNLGGNVITLGEKPDGSPWHIGIQHPRDMDRILGTLSVIDESVVTSGDYQRFFIDSMGRRCHHILNPVTGYPADSGLTSVTVVTKRSVIADALSTILFISGMEKGLELLKKYPATEAVFVDSNLRVFITGGLWSRFHADQGVEAVSIK